MAVPDANCIIHTHSRFGTAVATQKNGLLPASQKALTLMGWIGYHDFEGVALDLDERPRIVTDLGDRKLLILRNHGLMSVGETVGEAFVWMYRLNRACEVQALTYGAAGPYVMPTPEALSGGSELNPVSESTQEHTIAQGLKMYGEGGFIQPGREWPTLVRQLERLDGRGYCG